MLELTKRADYALRLMVEIAASEEDTLSTAEVARRQRIPLQFLRKVARELAVCGLLASSRGPRGGVSLARPAETVSLFEIVSAVEEPALSKCVVDPAECGRRSRCVIYPVWWRLQHEMRDAMSSVTLSSLADRHRDLTLRVRGGSVVGRDSAAQTAPKRGATRPISSRPDGASRRGASQPRVGSS